MDRTAEVLFDYLKNILYYPEKAELDVAALPADFKKLGEGMQFLGECIKEDRTFMTALARGDLSLEPPGAENILASSGKALQSALRHLQWQTSQVAKGDYSQHVDFMGEFSEAFNTMTSQLSERTENLIEEQKIVAKQNQALKRNLELLLSLANYTHNMIFVFSKKEKQKIFINRSARWFEEVNPDAAAGLMEKLCAYEKPESEDSDNWTIEQDTCSEKEKIYYNVESYNITWKEKPATVHLVSDDTKRKKQEQLIYSMAYVDPLTGVNNRRYAMNLMEHWISEGTPFLLSFIDVDYLKYCNDTFGHESGDRYLIDTAKLLLATRCEICRMGGDEFLLLCTDENADIEVHDAHLEHLRSLLSSKTDDDTPYPKSFSYATTIVPAFPSEPLSEYIRQTDEKMHQYKLANKKPLKGVVYRDDRI